MLSTSQIRAARALVRWSAQDLADASGIAVSTIRRLELEDGVPAAHVRTLEALKAALERAGIEFIGSPTDGPGVRLRITT
jgi:transcriptional regulator with XRE-family HTH domain